MQLKNWNAGKSFFWTIIFCMRLSTGRDGRQWNSRLKFSATNNKSGLILAISCNDNEILWAHLAYSLVNIQKTMENPHFSMDKSTISTGSFSMSQSIAMAPVLCAWIHRRLVLYGWHPGGLWNWRFSLWQTYKKLLNMAVYIQLIYPVKTWWFSIVFCMFTRGYPDLTGIF